MQNRIYEFATGFETSTQPDATAPVAANDIVTKAYADALVAGSTNEFQESFAGPGTNFTLTHTPSSASSVKLYVNGSFMTQGVHYTITGTAVVMASALTGTQTLDAVYRY